MDQSFGVQAVCVRELVAADEGGLGERIAERVRERLGRGGGLTPAGERSYDAGVHDVPDALDREVARIKLDAEGIDIDDLTDEQVEYLDDWRHGT
jgi:adenosylhomocysteinase